MFLRLDNHPRANIKSPNDTATNMRTVTFLRMFGMMLVETLWDTRVMIQGTCCSTGRRVDFTYAIQLIPEEIYWLRRENAFTKNFYYWVLGAMNWRPWRRHSLPLYRVAVIWGIVDGSVVFLYPRLSAVEREETTTLVFGFYGPLIDKDDSIACASAL
jgi:hypothetical protein